MLVVMLYTFKKPSGLLTLCLKLGKSYTNAAFKDSNGALGGMLTSWKSNFSSEFKLPLLHMLTTIIRHSSNFQIMITNVYDPFNDHLR
jgi:hypothetical protein